MGIAATWDPSPRGNPVVEQYVRGCFRRTIAVFQLGTWPLPVMFEHGFYDDLPGHIGRVLSMEESERGLEVMFVVEPEFATQLSARFGDDTTWHLSLTVCYHEFMIEMVEQVNDRPRMLINDCLATELSLTRSSAAGGASNAIALALHHTSTPQPIKVFTS